MDDSFAGEVDRSSTAVSSSSSLPASPSLSQPPPPPTTTEIPPATATALPAPPPRRTKVSCLPCRTRKSKCDHARPCSSCILRGTAHQCADPSGPAPAASSGLAPVPTPAPARILSSHSVVLTPPTLASKSRPLPTSVSLSAFPDYAGSQAAMELERHHGAQPKRRRTEAASPSLPASSPSYRYPIGSHADPQRSFNAPDEYSSTSGQEIAGEVQRMKHAMARLEQLLAAHRPSSSPSSQPQTELNSTPHSASAAHDYQLDAKQDDPGETNSPSPESRQRWHQLRSILPPLINTHLMMHYAFVEADWLLYYVEPVRFVARWKQAYDRQAISDIFAVQVLTVLACSALFLADNRQRTIHFAVPIRSLHTKLAKEAIQIVEALPAFRSGRTEAESCDMIEVMLNLSLYFRCIGKEVLMARFTERAISCSLRAGFDNELRPSWLALTRQQVERRRTLMMEVVGSAKWLAFHCRKDRAHLRVMNFNIGQAHLQHIGQLPSLSAWPHSDDVVRTAAQASEAQGAAASGHFFAWRNKSERESDVVRTYVRTSSSLAGELPSIVELVSKTEATILQPNSLTHCNKEGMRDMAKRTRQTLARLQEWFTVILPQAGVGFDRIVNAAIVSADPMEAKVMANILMLNHAVFYMSSIVCRAWLLLSDRLQSLEDAYRDRDPDYEQPTTVTQAFFDQIKQRTFESVQYRHASWLPPTFLADMEAAVVENSRRCIRSIPVIQTLQSHSSSQFYVGWTCQSFLQTAVNLAIPLVRSHHRNQHSDAEHTTTSSNTDSLRRDVVTIFEAVSQLSDNLMARRTAQVLNRALRLSGIERPLAHVDADDVVQDEWEAEESQGATSASGQMQNAAEGLALLSAASSAQTSTERYSGSSGRSSPALAYPAWKTTRGGNAHAASQTQLAPSHEALPAYFSAAATAAVPAPGEDVGAARELMWWETRAPAEAQHIQPGSDVGAGWANSADSGQQQNHMTDSQMLDELLNLDASFWQFVFEGTLANTNPTSTAAATSVA